LLLCNESISQCILFDLFLYSLKSAWNDSGDWKNYAAFLATLAGLYGVYRWATGKPVKPQEQPENPGEQNKKSAGPNVPAVQPAPRVDVQMGINSLGCNHNKDNHQCHL